MKKLGEEGVILPLVLAALVGLSLLATRLHDRARTVQSVSGVWQQEAQVRSERLQARDRLLFWVLQQPLTAWGFGEGAESAVRVDGRVYRLGPHWRASLQDARGLLQVNVASPPLMSGLLVQWGVPPDQADAYVDALADFVDLDDFQRLNGAEAAVYRRAGLPSPDNDWLQSADTLRRVWRWRDLPEVQRQPSDWFTAIRDGGLNVNTASRALLMSLPGMSREKADVVLNARERQPILSSSEWLALTGTTVPDDEPSWFYPRNFIRLRIWCAHGFAADEYHMMFTPGGRKTPYQIIEYRSVPRLRDEDADPPPQDLPDASLVGNPPAADGCRSLEFAGP